MNSIGYLSKWSFPQIDGYTLLCYYIIPNFDDIKFDDKYKYAMVTKGLQKIRNCYIDTYFHDLNKQYNSKHYYSLPWCCDINYKTKEYYFRDPCKCVKPSEFIFDYNVYIIYVKGNITKHMKPIVEDYKIAIYHNTEELPFNGLNKININQYLIDITNAKYIIDFSITHHDDERFSDFEYKEYVQNLCNTKYYIFNDIDFNYNKYMLQFIENITKINNNNNQNVISENPHISRKLKQN